jgi:hypothetical protein
MSGALQGPQRRRQVATTIAAAIASSTGQAVDPDPNELHVKEWGITEYSSVSLISDAIFEGTAPVVASSQSFAHFTGMTALASIAQSQELRLYSVRRRISEDELLAFIKDHDLLGYLDHGRNGEEVFRTLATDLFYISLTPTGLTSAEEALLWSGFGEMGTGIKLSLKFNVPQPIRRLYYAGSPTPLREVNDFLAASGFPPFVPHGLSRLIAYYLPAAYSHETECRLVLKRYEGGGGEWKSDGSHEYAALQLGPSGSGAPVELLSVAAGALCDIDTVRQAVEGTTLERVPIA